MRPEYVDGILDIVTSETDAVAVEEYIMSGFDGLNALVVDQLIPTLAELFAIRYVELAPTEISAVAVPL